jgi:hypothetical protein
MMRSHFRASRVGVALLLSTLMGGTCGKITRYDVSTAPAARLRCGNVERRPICEVDARDPSWDPSFPTGKACQTFVCDPLSENTICGTNFFAPNVDSEEYILVDCPEGNVGARCDSDDCTCVTGAVTVKDEFVPDGEECPNISTKSGRLRSVLYNGTGLDDVRMLYVDCHGQDAFCEEVTSPDASMGSFYFRFGGLTPDGTYWGGWSSCGMDGNDNDCLLACSSRCSCSVRRFYEGHGGVEFFEGGEEECPPAALLPAKVYRNDFEEPNFDLEPYRLGQLQDGVLGCPYFWDSGPNGQFDLNDIYGTGKNRFNQSYTSEVLFLEGMPWKSNRLYLDSNKTGGRYALGMLKGTSGEDDMTAVSFDRGSYTYVNIQFDISTMDLRTTCGGPFWAGTEDPVLIVSAIDSPHGKALLDGIRLDQERMVGARGPNQWTYQWRTRQVFLDVSKATNKHVSISWRIKNGGSETYTALDNLLIVASNKRRSFAVPYY